MSEKKHPTLLAHITGLDGLRAIAIVAVTLFHLFPNQIKGGYLGVSLFFMLSGFLMTYSSERKCYFVDMSARKFYLKRIKRIYPSLIIVTLVTIGVLYLLAPDSLGGMRREVLSMIGGYNNWWQIAQNSDYFTRISGISPFTHIWSLAIELQYYLIWPILYFIYLFLRIKKSEKASLAFLSTLTIIAFAWMPIRYFMGTDITPLYYGTDTRIHALLLGSLIGFEYVHPSIHKKKPKFRFAKPIYILCMIAFVLAAIFMDGQYKFTYIAGLPGMAIIFAIIVRLTAEKSLPFTVKMEAKPLKWLGDRSYELYLWQYPVLFLFIEMGWNEIPGYQLIIIGIILVLSVWLHSFTSFLFNEKQPYRFREFISLKNKKISIHVHRVACVCIVIFLIVGIGGLAKAPALKLSDEAELKAALDANAKVIDDSTDSSDRKDIANAQTLTEIDPLSVDYSATSNSAYVSKENMVMVGDSVMLACVLSLQDYFPDANINAEESRSVPDGVTKVKKMMKNGKITHTLVIGFGTNGIISQAKAEELFDAVGDDISVFWINIHGNKLTWTKQNNKMLQKLTKQHSNLTVVDWNSEVSGHKNWLYSDHVHPNLKGANRYADLLDETLDRVIAEQEAVRQSAAGEN
ncbi:acyltransferase family protein [Eubacterium oxidoreducens]|uniref:Peptidoglycan/LPS O-acetylase OafA/YrhL, contains acyltransferase and SGNH-hydrolase domains n=1 Tax=Eubacterium oxidoreducens TaxID=1732 RepID=A0A1G6A4R9_EUBOX|nr:acyltransferase family protein [Eubacterium oxidoreducens]SDB03417.1 Peptidoglycan/LPS O-acetylase OafA/YrhL, contains acyltransferase and SGNH-hydrolase domains [Eubacterium oxidoreducens]